VDSARVLLYAITRELFELGLSVARAKIGTFLDQVVDVFYVTDQQNGKSRTKAASKKSAGDCSMWSNCRKRLDVNRTDQFVKMRIVGGVSRRRFLAARR
jgi:hypothetical protein